MRTIYLKVCIFIVITAGGAFAQERPAPAPPDYNFRVTVAYYVCVEPASSPECVAPSAEERTSSCPDCRTWKRETKSEDLALDVGSIPTYEASNYFTHDIASKLYGRGIGDSEEPNATMREFYLDPQKFGWIEIDRNMSKLGTFAVLPNLGGVVVSEEGKSPEVVYPSAKLEGKPWVEDVAYLSEGSEIKYMLPIDFIESVASKSPEER